jgi:hypothetical protein
MVDYSKWNNIAVSSDEEEEEGFYSEQDDEMVQHEHSANCIHSKLMHHQERHAVNMRELEVSFSSLCTVRKPQLPVEYVGSPIQRMQYRFVNGLIKAKHGELIENILKVTR